MGDLLSGAARGLTPQNNFHAVDPAIMAQQKALAAALQATAEGRGPNAAQANFQQNIGQASKQVQGATASQKGISPALAQRLGAEAGASMSQKAAGASATMEAQQQATAQSQEAGVLSNIGSEQAGTQNVNAGVAQSNATANQNTAGGLLSGASDIAWVLSDGGQIPEHMHELASIYHDNWSAPGAAKLKAVGGPVKGPEVVKGDSPKNDVVKTLLSGGEEVLPKHVMESENPPQAAYDFVAEELKKRGKSEGKGDHKEFKEALKNAISNRRAA